MIFSYFVAFQNVIFKIFRLILSFLYIKNIYTILQYARYFWLIRINLYKIQDDFCKTYYIMLN